MSKNKIKSTKKLKSKPLIFLILSISVFLIGGTFAYYYANYSLPNIFKTMTYNININEEFNGNWGTRKIYITNSETSNTSVVLRINYNEIWSKTVDGTPLTLSNTVNGINVVNKEWTSTFNNDFVDGQDGWYYYKKLLSPNQTIQILESISLNNDLISTSPYYDDYLTYNYEMLFNYEALEVNREKIKEIWNKTITVNGINISWD